MDNGNYTERYIPKRNETLYGTVVLLFYQRATELQVLPASEPDSVMMYVQSHTRGVAVCQATIRRLLCFVYGKVYDVRHPYAFSLSSEK
jgi:hypothetical protein